MGSHNSRQGAGGQILVIFALGLIVLISGVALVVDGGNAYVQQRGVQNGADAAANAGADVIAQKLVGLNKTDADVNTAMQSSSTSNNITKVAYYTDVTGAPIDATGAIVAASAAVVVGSAPGNMIPTNAQGVHTYGSRTFGTTFGRVIGINNFLASAEATAITGKIIGGGMFPVVFPVNITDCSGSGNLGIGQSQWPVSQPGVPPAHPVGQEYIVPLCKTGGGSFMVINLDGELNNCEEEVRHPAAVQWQAFPVTVESDQGNNCASAMVDAVNEQHGETVMIPVCDDNDCNTSGGSHATYHVTGVASFYIDYMSDGNAGNPLCQARTNSEGQSIIPITGNGSTSCIAGWFVRFITVGPVGAGFVGNADGVAIQLIK